MGESGDIYLKRLQGRLGDLVFQMTRVQFSPVAPPPTWSPALNVYRCDRCIVVCADLAGVAGSAVALQVEPRRLVLRGTRAAPEPAGHAVKPVQVLAMEIDYGPFSREIVLPVEVDPEQTSAEQQNGLLWIYLTVRAQA